MQIKSFKELFQNLDLKKTFAEIYGKEITYDSFLKEIRKIASIPQVHNLAVGSQILVSLKDDVELVKTTVGLIASGLTVVLIDTETKSRRVENILSTANISGWVIDKENLGLWNLPEGKLNIAIEGASKTGGVVLKLLKKKEESDKFTFKHWLSTLPSVENFRAIPEDTKALILFTSGSTSDPKGVPLSHKNILVHLATLQNQYNLDQQSCMLNLLPMHHVDGFIQGPLLALFTGAKVIRPFKFEVNKIEDLLHSIYKFRISHFFVVPTMLQLLLKFGSNQLDAFQSPEFKYLISSAGMLDATLWMNFSKVFDVSIINVYGLTETVAGGLFHLPKDGKCRAGSIGKPKDLEAKVVDDHGDEVNEGIVGELYLRGDSIIDSYLVDDDNPCKEGWFRTGDLVTKDSDGFYYIKGRKKNVIIRGGVNIYAEEIIECINMHPQVNESFAIGISDDIWGERSVAVIASEGELQEEEIMQHMKENTEPKNLPDSIHFVDSLPKGTSGKIVSSEVKKMIQPQDSTSQQRDDAGSNIDIKSAIIHIASQCFTNDVSPEQYHFKSVQVEGWNSLAHLQLATLIEKQFKIKLSVKDIMNITSLVQAEDIVRKKLG